MIGFSINPKREKFFSTKTPEKIEKKYLKNRENYQKQNGGKYQNIR